MPARRDGRCRRGQGGEGVTSLISRADQGLYAAKAVRNRVQAGAS